MLFEEGIQAFKGEAAKEDVYNVSKKHFLTFLNRLATDLGIQIEDIIDFELNAYDCHPPAITGLHNEFVSSPRLDNLASSLCSLDALITHHQSGSKDNADVSIIMLFDHEEIGSKSGQGADSNMLVETAERIFFGLRAEATREDYYRMIRKSFFVSADMAHAVHPNYPEKHQACHHPKFDEGIVFKYNAN